MSLGIRPTLVIGALLASLIPSAAFAQAPALTTIRDTIYRADGQPFNGILLIQWRNFQAPPNASIGIQATTVRVVNGSLNTRLASTTGTDGAYYHVRYNSDGQFQFTEIWAVAASSTPLRLSQVRASLLPGGVVVGGGGGGVIVGDNTAVVPGFVDGERPSGTLNGTNAVFTLASAPSPATSLTLFRNGLLQTAGLDFTVAGATITFLAGAIPQAGDLLEAYYRIGGNPSTGPVNTGLTTGSIPFIGTNGVLTENSSLLVWNNLSRRMSVGNNIARGTLNVFDNTTGAITEMVVRAGSGQGSVPMQTWISNAGEAVAWVNADGGFNVRRVLANSTSLRPGMSDSGTATDPIGGALANGDVWFNNAIGSRKTYEGSQTHTSPQIICSAVGTATSSTGLTNLGTCTIPAALRQTGDRFEIRANYARTGSTAGEVEIAVGLDSLGVSSFPTGGNNLAYSASLGFAGSAVAWSSQSIHSTAGTSVGTGQLAPPGGSVQIFFRARLNTSTSDTLSLLNFTVVRQPTQVNP
ncbi:MAG: hypothetical protein K2Q23_06185 [Bryobacteraceae bacterium]|nr:hypothetical protein [Bryobacteraceae bacterium]